jgi:hypothetical protein
MKNLIILFMVFTLSACTMTIPIGGEPTQSVQRNDKETQKVESLNANKVKAAETAKVKQEEKEKKAESQPTQDEGRGGGMY